MQTIKNDIFELREKNIAFYEERDKKSIFKKHGHSLLCFEIIMKGNLSDA